MHRSGRVSMDWFQAVNSYCERTGAGYWAEPLNAVSNAMFLVAALYCWPRTEGDPGARVLCGILALIGIGSYLFHTHAQVWALLADVIPIQAFILVYLYLATVRFFAVPRWVGGVVVIAFIPCAALVARGLGALVGELNGSIGYLPVPILIAAYAVALRDMAPRTARGLGIGAGLLAVSLTFRSVDIAICGAVPVGTHFLWHVLNGIMLGWMILVLVRHAPGAGLAERRPAR